MSEQPEQPEQPETTSILDVVFDFPRYVVDHLAGLVRVILSEFEATALAIIGVLLALVTSVPLGGAIALGLYVALRFAATNIRGFAAQRQAHHAELVGQINFLSRIVRDNPYFAEKQEDRSHRATEAGVDA